jgi:hypothetical protein
MTADLRQGGESKPFPFLPVRSLLTRESNSVIGQARHRVRVELQTSEETRALTG